MKKTLVFLLIWCILLSAVGCGNRSDTKDEPILFFYPRIAADYEYGSPDGVIFWEERDPAGHRNNLRYLMTLYLLGPVDESLISPFPEGCQIVDLSRNESEVIMTLNSNFVTLKDMDLTLACISLARTCFGLTEVNTVRIMSESFDGQIAIDKTITRQQLLTEDVPLPTK